jgi:hypothetical protein
MRQNCLDLHWRLRRLDLDQPHSGSQNFIRQIFRKPLVSHAGKLCSATFARGLTPRQRLTNTCECLLTSHSPRGLDCLPQDKIGILFDYIFRKCSVSTVWIQTGSETYKRFAKRSTLGANTTTKRNHTARLAGCRPLVCRAGSMSYTLNFPSNNRVSSVGKVTTLNQKTSSY